LKNSAKKVEDSDNEEADVIKIKIKKARLTKMLKEKK
jgi:hypothetical protein